VYVVVVIATTLLLKLDARVHDWVSRGTSLEGLCSSLELVILVIRMQIVTYFASTFVWHDSVICRRVKIRSRLSSLMANYIKIKRVELMWCYAAKEFSVEMYHGIYIIPLDFTIRIYSRDLLQAPDII